MEFSEFAIVSQGQSVDCLLAQPGAEALAKDPALLLTFVLDRRGTHEHPMYGIPTRLFVAAGHRALSFDPPCHAQRAAPGAEPGINAFREAFLAGDDPFERFIADARAAIDACLARGLTRPGRIVACGVSRSGYCVLRLAAADPRVVAVSALAPVTDWLALHEFAALRGRPDAAGLDLENFAAPLVGRPVYVAMGNADRRVGSEACARFVARLALEEGRQNLESSRLLFHLVNDSPGHTLSARWRQRGAAFLLRALDRQL